MTMRIGKAAREEDMRRDTQHQHHARRNKDVQAMS